MDEMQSHRSGRRRPGVEEKRVGNTALGRRQDDGSSQRDGGRRQPLQQPDTVGRDRRRGFDDATIARRSAARRFVRARRRGVHRAMGVRAVVMRRRFVVPMPGAGMLARRLVALGHRTGVLHQRQAAAQEQQRSHEGRHRAKDAKRSEHDYAQKLPMRVVVQRRRSAGVSQKRKGERESHL